MRFLFLPVPFEGPAVSSSKLREIISLSSDAKAAAVEEDTTAAE
jgi:hypothetical protein